MYPYNPHSQKAEEFINHEEILETLAYAEENKHNIPLLTALSKRQGSERDFLTERQWCFWTAIFPKKTKYLRAGKAD